MITNQVKLWSTPYPSVELLISNPWSLLSYTQLGFTWVSVAIMASWFAQLITSVRACICLYKSVKSSGKTTHVRKLVWRNRNQDIGAWVELRILWLVESAVWTSQLWILQTLGYVILLVILHMHKRISHVQVPYFGLKIILRKVGFWVKLFYNILAEKFCTNYQINAYPHRFSFSTKMSLHKQYSYKACTHMGSFQMPNIQYFPCVCINSPK